MGAAGAAGGALSTERPGVDRLPATRSSGAGVSTMSHVTASIHIAAPPRTVWDTVLDPSCLGEWVTIHRRLIDSDAGPPREGFTMDQQIHMRGVSLEVHWELVECIPCERAVWEGRGPARSRARTEYLLSAEGDGTRFDYQNEFQVPLGPVGALVSRALVGGMPEREARRTLQRLRELLESRARARN